MGNLTEADVGTAMHELARKELVRSSRRSSMEGEAEYAFWHVLARDVAYGQTPRASRASRDVAAAAWFSRRPPTEWRTTRTSSRTITPARSSSRGRPENRSGRGAREAGAPFVTLSGARALGLDTDAALESFERALALTPPDHSARADALRRFGEVAYQAARASEAAVALEEAFELFRARGDKAAAVVLITLRWSYDALNDPRRFDLRREALALLEGIHRDLR